MSTLCTVYVKLNKKNFVIMLCPNEMCEYEMIKIVSDKRCLWQKKNGCKSFSIKCCILILRNSHNDCKTTQNLLYHKARDQPQNCMMNQING